MSGVSNMQFNTNEEVKLKWVKFTQQFLILIWFSNCELTAIPALMPRQPFSPATEKDLHGNEEAMEEAKDEQDLYDALLPK